MKHSFAILLLCSVVNSQAQTSAPPPVTDETPPGLVVGDLQLVFREGVDPAKLDALVADTRQRASERRAKGAKDVLAMYPAKLKGWNGSWASMALYQGDWAKEANAMIRKHLADMDAQEAKKSDASKKTPNPEDGEESDTKAPSSKHARMLALNEAGFWIRFLAMYGRGGRYPGRLEADVEADIEERAWNFVSGLLQESLLPLTWAKQWGTENHDVRRKPWTYLALSALRNDPAYSGKSVGGHTVTEWYGLMNDFMKVYLKDRVLAGMWLEPGGHYAHHTFEVLISLYDAAPDPEIRQRAKMFLDLALIEDEQISVNGYRAGARSRTAPFVNTTSKSKSPIFGDAPGLETSDYQAPAIAIVLRNAKGAVGPFHIRNRVPGECAPEGGYLHNSHLVNYTYRTPGYVLGSAFLDPNRAYGPISDQRRWSGSVFQSGEAVYPWPTKETVMRSSKAFWGVQHDGSMVVQKLLKAEGMERLGAVFTPGLKITELEGWIFAEAGSGYAAVRFVDPRQPSGQGRYTLHENVKQQAQGKIAAPERDFLPIVLQAGDPAQYGSFEKFQKAVLAGKITISAKASVVEYQPVGGQVITWNYKQDANPLVLPRVHGKTPDLQPALLFDSPFLKAKWEDPKIYAGAGPFRAVYDMEKCTITESDSQE
jgi:hypothetical protein